MFWVCSDCRDSYTEYDTPGPRCPECGQDLQQILCPFCADPVWFLANIENSYGQQIGMRFRCKQDHCTETYVGPD